MSGAGDNAIDFVAVQYGHIVDSRIHDAGDWCAYAKGGSASIRVARNEIHDCGTGGFTAGQGTGFQFMTSPWLHYEAYEIRVHDNVDPPTPRARGSASTAATTSCSRTTRSTGSARGRTRSSSSSARAAATADRATRAASGAPQHLAAGGWGTTVVDDGDNSVRIPNRNVLVYNNLVYNPSGQGEPGPALLDPRAVRAAGRRAGAPPQPTTAWPSAAT